MFFSIFEKYKCGLTTQQVQHALAELEISDCLNPGSDVHNLMCEIKFGHSSLRISPQFDMPLKERAKRHSILAFMCGSMNDILKGSDNMSVSASSLIGLSVEILPSLLRRLDNICTYLPAIATLAGIDCDSVRHLLASPCPAPKCKNIPTQVPCVTCYEYGPILDTIADFVLRSPCNLLSEISPSGCVWTNVSTGKLLQTLCPHLQIVKQLPASDPAISLLCNASDDKGYPARKKWEPTD